MPRLLLVNHVILFLCCSVCLGLGVGLILWGEPFGAAPERLFTWLTSIMVATSAAMLLTEWFTGIRWAAAIIFLAAAGALIITIFCIPGHDEGDDLRDLLDLRALFWALAWAATMYWFYRMAAQARGDR